MMWSVWISSLLFISITEGRDLNNFPTNSLLVMPMQNATITCKTTTDKSITWKINNVDLKDIVFKDELKEDGHLLNLYEVYYPMSGEYSCWSEGQKLHSIHLLVEAETSSNPFHCWAKSYDCSFNCKWNSNEYKAARVGLGPYCANRLESCHWVMPSLPLNGKEFVFHLNHSLPPYTEEQMLEVTAEAIHHGSIVRETKTFFLREIIKPDSPQIVKCQMMDQKLEVITEPPPTWSSINSFYSLENQIEYVDENNVEQTVSTLIPSTVSKLRVRCRDSLLQSNWSDWSGWFNTRMTKSGQATTCSLSLNEH